MWHFCHGRDAGGKICCDAARKHLHAAAAKAILRLADALRRTAFLDVSSLNFGGAKSTAVFLFAAVGSRLLACSTGVGS